MGGPYLESGESIVLTTDRVRFNAVQYDVLLTTRHLILVDAGQTRFQPSMYPLRSIVSVKGGKTANGEFVISISFDETAVKDDSGLMILIFSRQPGEQRKSERDEWIRKLMELIVSVRQETNKEGFFPDDEKEGIQPYTRRTFAPDMPIPFKTAPDTSPAQVEFTVIPDEPEPPVPSDDDESEVRQCEETETPVNDDLISLSPDTGSSAINDSEAIPVNTELDPESHATLFSAIHNIDAPPFDAELVPESAGSLSTSVGDIDATPVENGQLPEYSGILSSSIQDREESSSDAEPVPESAVTSLSSINETEIVPVDAEPVPESPITQSSQLLNREEQAENAELVPKSPDSIVIPEASITDDLTVSFGKNAGLRSIPETSREIPVVTREDTGYVDLSLHPEQRESGPLQNSFDKEPDAQELTIPETIPDTAEVQEPFQEPVAGATSPPGEIPPQDVDPGSKRLTFIAVTAILAIILVIAGAGVYYSAFGPPLPVTAAPKSTPTPELTLQQTSPVPTQVIIPANGIWVRVVYPGDFYGWLGSAGSLRGVNSSGEQIYKLPERAETIQVNMYKPDNSGKTLVVEVYREGKMINNRSISVPMGSIELLIDANTGIPPGLSPTVTPSVNQTGSGSGRIMYF